MNFRSDWPEKLTAQEVYDHAVAHMRAQKRQCAESGECAYRSSDGKEACAVGALLTDDEARKIAFQGHNWGTSVKHLVRVMLLPTRLHEHEALLTDLQMVHDHYLLRPLPRGAEDELQRLCKQHSLTYSPPAPPSP